MATKDHYLVAIDQGTSSSRCIILDAGGSSVASAQQEFPQAYPKPGWVEHDPEAIWNSVVSVTRDALAAAGDVSIAGLGLTNQRETTLYGIATPASASIPQSSGRIAAPRTIARA